MSERRVLPVNLQFSLGLLILLGLLALMGLVNMGLFYAGLAKDLQLAEFPTWLHLLAAGLAVQFSACAFGVHRILFTSGLQSAFNGASLALAVMLLVQVLRSLFDLASVIPGHMQWWAWALRALVAVALIAALASTFPQSAWGSRIAAPEHGPRH